MGTPEKNAESGPHLRNTKPESVPFQDLGDWHAAVSLKATTFRQQVPTMTPTVWGNQHLLEGREKQTKQKAASLSSLLSKVMNKTC